MVLSLARLTASQLNRLFSCPPSLIQRHRSPPGLNSLSLYDGHKHGRDGRVMAVLASAALGTRNGKQLLASEQGAIT